MQNNLRRHRPDIMVIGGGKALRLLVGHDLIKDCPYKVAVKNLVKGKGL